jgi:hypothetical protein
MQNTPVELQKTRNEITNKYVELQNTPAEIQNTSISTGISAHNKILILLNSSFAILEKTKKRKCDHETP